MKISCHCLVVECYVQELELGTKISTIRQSEFEFSLKSIYYCKSRESLKTCILLMRMESKNKSEHIFLFTH